MSLTLMRRVADAQSCGHPDVHVTRVNSRLRVSA